MKVTELDSNTVNAKISKNSLCGWKKTNIFWDLPYRKINLIRHNLDVMHIEKEKKVYILMSFKVFIFLLSSFGCTIL